MKIDTLVSNQNPQWFDERYLPVEGSWLRREAFSDIESWFEKRFILALTGLRRVGKSTILKQMISDLIEKNRRKDCFYFSCEKIQTKPNPNFLKEIIETYFNTVALKKPYQIQKKVYFFFDEIQNIPQWQEVIKFYYDQNENFKFIICGSNSLFIKRKSKESLGGRIIEMKIPPLSFREYLKLATPEFKIIYNNKIWVLANLDIINARFESYLRFGQFPEVIKQKLNENQTKTYLESIEEKITQQDLPKSFPIDYPEVLLAIFNQIKQLPGQRVEYQSIAKDVGIDQRTLSKYFDYLEKGFLVSLCLNFGKKPIKAPRIAKKAYLASSNFSYDAPIPASVENYVFNFLKQKYPHVYFQKDMEIDFVSVDRKSNIYLFEVKYQNEVNSSDTANILNFMRKKAVKQSILITRKHLNLNGKIHQIPASLLEFQNIHKLDSVCFNSSTIRGVHV